MNAMNEGVRRSLMVSNIARLQGADASAKAPSAAGAINWGGAAGGEAFYGPISVGPTSVPVEVATGWVETGSVGVGQHALRVLSGLLHRQRRTV